MFLVSISLVIYDCFSMFSLNKIISEFFCKHFCVFSSSLIDIFAVLCF